MYTYDATEARDELIISKDTELRYTQDGISLSRKAMRFKETKQVTSEVPLHYLFYLKVLTQVFNVFNLNIIKLKGSSVTLS